MFFFENAIDRINSRLPTALVLSVEPDLDEVHHLLICTSKQMIDGGGATIRGGGESPLIQRAV
jgi:hypothetical protein